MPRFISKVMCLAGLALAAAPVHAAMYWFSADPASVNVAPGSTSSSVNVYLNSDTPFYGVYDSYTELNVQAGGNATLDSVNYSYDVGASTSSPTFGEITDAGLVDGPSATPMTSVLLGNFDVDMPANGTLTTVTLDQDTTAEPVIYVDGTPDGYAAVSVTSGQAVFSPVVPEPAAVLSMGMIGLAALSRASRKQLAL
ncbi:MAG TPA: hypothetical protein VGG19_14065 [Tepidisphaeraceae bacterium]|jgi:hypothetical protein